MKSKKYKLSFLGLIFFFFAFSLWGTPEEILQEANASYQKGEQAKTYEEQKFAFNQALFLYSSLEQEIESPSAALNQALADTYFQLGKYAWAILYYQRALKKEPNNSLTLSRLKKAEHLLGVSSSIHPQEWMKRLTSLSEQFPLFFWIISITFIACSCAIWFPILWVRTLAAISTLFLLILLGNFLFVYYFTPLEGILIKATGFYRAPDWNQPQLTHQPLFAGSKVQVLQMTPDKEWIKIQNLDGTIGYIPINSLQPI